MLEYLQTYESQVRLACFVGVLTLLFVLERLWPRRSGSHDGRIAVNLALVILNTVLLRLCFPVMAVGVALWAGSEGLGLMHWLTLPLWVELTAVVVLLDMAIYWQHRLMHWVPWLWRLHRVHHSDLAFDVSTGVRFHPAEIFVSMLIKMLLVLVLGADVVAVILFEILLSASSLFEHANLRLPLWLDKGLRTVIVTPDMHRVHHSIHRDETDSNFGFNLSIWDRAFLSYRAQPRSEHETMAIGLPAYRGQEDQGLLRLLRQPIDNAGTGTTQ